jgi:hypothetical protein
MPYTVGPHNCVQLATQPGNLLRLAVSAHRADRQAEKEDTYRVVVVRFLLLGNV